MSEEQGEKVTQELLGVNKFDDEPATVQISMGATLNMGNYESLRVGVGLTLPCKPSARGIESAFKRGTTFVEKKMDKLIQKHRGAALDVSANDDDVSDLV